MLPYANSLVNRVTCLLAAFWIVCGVVSGLPTAARAASAEANPDKQITLTAMGLPTQGNTSAAALAQRAVLREFYKKYPGVRIKPFSMPSVGGTGGSSMDSGPLMAIAAGMPPNVIYVNFRQSSTYLGQGFLEPLDQLLARVLSENPAERQTDGHGNWREDPTEQELAQARAKIKTRVPGLVWPVVYREDESGESREKHVWAIPTAFLVQALLYRKDLFAVAGLDPDKPPENWKQLMNYARRLTVPSRQQIGISFAQGINISYSMYNLLAATGMRAVQRDASGDWHATFGTRGAARATYFVWRLLNEPFHRNGKLIRQAGRAMGSELGQLWSQGKIAMRFSDLDQEMLGTLNPQTIGIAPPPAGPGGHRASQFNARMLGVFSEDTPRQKLAAMRYIWYLTSTPAKRIRTRIYVDNGFGLFVNPELLKEFGYNRTLQQVPPNWRKTFVAAKKTGVPEPYGRNTQNIYRYMSEPINQALARDYSHMSKKAAVADIFGLFREAQREVNRKVLGNLPPAQMKKRRIIGGIVMVVVMITILVGFVRIWRYFGQRIGEGAAPAGNPAKRYFWGYVLLVPALAITVLWAYAPLAGGFVMAFTNYQIVLPSHFVAVDNFANVLFDAKFWSGLWYTLLYVSLVIGLGFWPPILLALLLDEIPTEFLKYLFRTLFYLPAIISGIIVIFLWKELYDPTPYGAINQVYLQLNALPWVLAIVVKWVALALYLSLVYTLVTLPIKLDEMGNGMRVILWAVAAVLLWVVLWPVLGPLAAGRAGETADLVGRLFHGFDLERLRFVKDPQTAMFWVVLPMVWMTAGPGCLLYLAALKTIPEDLYEAADIDGAGNWHKVFYITLPRIKYLVMIQFITAVVAAFKGGTNYILAMTGGGPNGKTMILSLEIFMRTFFELQFGIGTAMAWILGALLIMFTAYQMKLLSRADFKAAG